jgi:hypothetical protein
MATRFYERFPRKYNPIGGIETLLQRAIEYV